MRNRPGRLRVHSAGDKQPWRPGLRSNHEVRHQSEDIDDKVLLDVVRALRRRVRTVSHDYDIPYIAGHSEDARTIYIDRHLPRTFRWLVKKVRVEPFLLTHEIVEKALLDELRLHYLHAHQIAARAERDVVVALSRLHETIREEDRAREADQDPRRSRSHALSR
jgi:hypothetical protein